MKRNVLIVMCAGLFVVLLDVTIVNVALPSIAADRHAGLADLQWVVDGYQLALAGLLLTGGTLGDRFGHRRVVPAGFALFGAASAGCALAPGIGALVAARTVQGVGAALLLPGTLASPGPSPAARSGPGPSGSGPRWAARPCPPGRCSAGCWSRRSAGPRSSRSTCRSSW